MAHDNNGRIYIGTTGVEIADIQAVLNLPNTDIGALITEGATQGLINKWAKCKPIRYYIYDSSTQQKTPYPGLLTGDMWKGPLIEQTDNGIYYGIEVHVPGVNQQMNTWPLLHGTTFTYCPPRGLSYSELFRIRDFEEYRQNARPNPDASFGDEGSATGYYNNENGITGITIRYYDPNPPQGQTGNEWGVDLTGVLLNPSESATAALAETYPCIIVGKGNTHYITALGYEDDANHYPRPMYYQGAYVGGTWVADTSKPVFDKTGHTSVAPWTSAQSGLTATIVLLRSAFTGIGSKITLDALGTQDLAVNWFECILDADIITNETPVPMPGAVGVGLSLVQYTNGVTASATGITYDSSFDKVTVPLSWTGTPLGGGSFTVDVYTTIGAASGPMKTVSGSTTFQRVMPAIYDLSDDFDILYNPGSHQTYNVSIRVVTHDGSATNTAITQFQLTI